VRAATLYHHVRSKSELLRLAGEHSIDSMILPPDRGQPWFEWLRDFARGSRAILLTQPDLLHQLATGAVGLDRVVDAVEIALEVLTREGFSAEEAVAVFLSVSQCTVGAAIHEIRGRRVVADVESAHDELRRVLAMRRPHELVELRRLMKVRPQERDYERLFELQVDALLAGFAVRRGEDWRATGAGAPARASRRPRTR
jgi:hypothetical protein